MIEIIKKKIYLDKSNLTSSGLTTFINPVSYLKARNDRTNYQNFDAILADGWFFVAALKAVGIHTHRYSFDMTSLAPVVFSTALEKNQTLYFLGAKPKEIADFINTIKAQYPELNIIGFRDGYFKDAAERAETLEAISILSPDIVIAGLGVPLQEKFLVDLQKTGWSGHGYTCGGFIHQTSERLHYYPDWVNKSNLRMPYRFIKEPHFRKRLPDYVKFVFLFLYDYWQYRKK